MGRGCNFPNLLPKCPTKCFIFQLKCSMFSQRDQQQDLLAFPGVDGIADYNIDYPDNAHHIRDFFINSKHFKRVLF